LPSGLALHADTEADHARIMQLFDRLPPPEALQPARAPVLASTDSPTARPMLSRRIVLFLRQFKQKKRSEGNQLDTRH
jgi:hypothetical protein